MTKPSVGGSILTSIMTLFGPSPTPQPGGYAAPQPDAGMSTNTKIAIGVGVVGLVALVLISTGKQGS
jgi:hypothetical protein